MTRLPILSESDVRVRASVQSWSRGRAYFKGGQVNDSTWRGGVLTAGVQGSSYTPYQVTIHFTDGEILSASCTCPYAFGGDCKHMVAVLLSLIHEPDTIRQRPPISELLASLDREELIALLTSLVDSDPTRMDEVEGLLVSVARGTPKPSSGVSSAIDGDLLRRQIKADIHSSIHTGYDSWGEEAFYDSDPSVALTPGLNLVEERLHAENPLEALALLEIITHAWQEGMESLDEALVEYFWDIAEEFTGQLGERWAEALLAADRRGDLSREAWLEWADTLGELADSMFGGGSLEMAVTACEQGWDYPPLQNAMNGQITEQGAWEEEDTTFADDLALVRLGILEQRGEYQAYLNLAQAEGQFMLYLHMLAKQGQGDKALVEAQEFLTRPAEILALARTLANQGEGDKAIQLARHGLGLDEAMGKGELAVWLRDQALAAGQGGLALWSAKQALGYHVSLTNYQALQTLAEDEWTAIRQEALTLVNRGDPTEGKVDVYLHEGMHDEAIAVVDESRWFANIDPVIEAVKSTHPEWAFDQCRESADEIMDAGRAKDYDVAAEWVRRGRDILVAAGLDGLWRTYIDHLMHIHGRKYKLMPMLRDLV